MGIARGRARGNRAGRASLCAAELTPDLAMAVTGAAFDDQLLVWDLTTGRVRRTLKVGLTTMPRWPSRRTGDCSPRPSSRCS